MKLRPYQADVFRAIMRAVVEQAGGTYTVMFSRQAGKNETSAYTERALLAAHQLDRRTGIKAAPTLVPQAQISRDRLTKLLDAAGYNRLWRERGHFVYLVKSRWAFVSGGRESNVVGLTADLLLEGDEAQDLDVEKFDKEFRPMAATTNAPVVLWGTAWTDDTLLAQAIAANADRHPARNFKVKWDVVAEHVPAYGAYVISERARLGANHPLFLTQYELEELPGAGRLFSAAQLSQMHGDHERELAPAAGYEYVAGLDVAGEDPADQVLRGRDSTVLTIGRLLHQEGAPPEVQVVTAYESTGTQHGELYAQLGDLLGNVWRVRRVAVDSTTLGEAVALTLERQLGESRVRKVRFTQASKSHLGFEGQAAATTGRLKMWQDDGSEEWRRLWFQLKAGRAEYKPNRLMGWGVPPAEGHDDYLASVLLCLEAARDISPATARGRRRERRL